MAFVIQNCDVYGYEDPNAHVSHDGVSSLLCQTGMHLATYRREGSALIPIWALCISYRYGTHGLNSHSVLTTM